MQATGALLVRSQKSNLMSFIGGFLSVYVFGSRACRVLKAAKDAFQVIDDPKLSTYQKTHRVVSNALLIACACRNTNIQMRPQLYSHDPSKIANLQTKAQLAEEGANVLVQFSRKQCDGNSLKCADYWELAIQSSPAFSAAFDLACDESKLRDYIHKFNSPTLSSLLGEKPIKSIQDSLQALLLMVPVAKKIKRILSKKQQQSPSLQLPQPQAKACQKIKQKFEEIGDAAAAVSFLDDPIDQIHQVPEFLEERCKHYPKCSITKKPIRYVVVAEGKSTRPYYEKKTLQNWIKKHPNAPPLEWPKSAPYPPIKVYRPTKLQSLIDAKLIKYQGELL